MTKIERIDYFNEEDNLDKYLHIRRYELVKRFLKEGSILDLGCGLGWGTNFLSSKGEIIGLDLNIEVVRAARERYNNNKKVIFVVGDATKLPFKNEVFDSVSSIENIEHVKESSKYLEEVNRILKGNGVLVLTTPNQDCLSIRLAKKFGIKIDKNPYHIKEFNSNDLKVCLEYHRFQVLLIKGIYLPLLPGVSFLKKIRGYLGFYKLLVNIDNPKYCKYIFIFAKKR